MTFDRKIIVGLDDIKAVSLECTTVDCSSKITFPPGEIPELPHQCPRGHRWTVGGPTGEFQTKTSPLHSFLKALNDATFLDSQKMVGFRIRLEFDAPKAW